MFGGKIQLWLMDTSRNLKISSLFGHIPLGQAIGAQRHKITCRKKLESDSIKYVIRNSQ